MKEILIDYVVGDKAKPLKITFTSNGAGQIILDNYYQGQAVFAQSQWRIYLNDKSDLNNAEEIQSLVHLITDRC